MSDTLYQLTGVGYAYQNIPAVDDLTLRIGHGERIALLGANGSGKSTLLRLLDALYFAQGGDVSFCGQPLNEAWQRDDKAVFALRRRVGLVFQNPDVQLFNPTVFDEIAFGPLQLRWEKPLIRERVAQIMENMEIAHLKDRSPHRLSGGEKKRVALASVLILDPDVLLLDEPTVSLDPVSASHLIDFMIGWDAQKTLIVATHDLDTVEVIANRCLVLDRGRLVADAAPAQLLGDFELLQRTHLVHAHRHTHASGLTHVHPHRHMGHEHSHDHTPGHDHPHDHTD